MTVPTRYRLYFVKSALLLWLTFLKPLGDEHDAIAITRDVLRRHPDVDASIYDWRQATVIVRERRAYVVRVPVRVVQGEVTP